VDLLAVVSAWVAAGLIVAAALIPLGHRVLAGRRAVPASRTITSHFVVGLSAAAMAVVHTFAIVPALGEPAAIRGGMTAIAPATVAFFLLFAHVGVGLRLRNPRLKDRARIRRWHVALASTILVMVAAHVTALVLAS
jgi:hypothetical protein